MNPDGKPSVTVTYKNGNDFDMFLYLITVTNDAVTFSNNQGNTVFYISDEGNHIESFRHPPAMVSSSDFSLNYLNSDVRRTTNKGSIELQGILSVFWHCFQRPIKVTLYDKAYVKHRKIIPLTPYMQITRDDGKDFYTRLGWKEQPDIAHLLPLRDEPHRSVCNKFEEEMPESLKRVLHIYKKKDTCLLSKETTFKDWIENECTDSEYKEKILQMWNIKSDYNPLRYREVKEAEPHFSCEVNNIDNLQEFISRITKPAPHIFRGVQSSRCRSKKRTRQSKRTSKRTSKSASGMRSCYRV